jgi:hypothetical protein
VFLDEALRERRLSDPRFSADQGDPPVAGARPDKTVLEHLVLGFSLEEFSHVDLSLDAPSPSTT